MSSSTDVAVSQSHGTQTVSAQSPDANDGRYYEFEWHKNEYNEPATTRNVNGTTGWATITHSSNPALKERTQCRIHLCAFDPCRAAWPATKYGLVGPPKHLREVPKQSELSAVAAPSGSQLPLPAAVQVAVVGSSSEEPPPAAELAPVGPAPVVEPSPAEESATAVKQADMAEVPDCPNGAALSNMKPPAPASPTHVDTQSIATATADAVGAVASPAVAAQHKIRTTLLALAREIRRPRSYVGYSAFILMGLKKECRPCIWEGAQFIDVLDVFAPWAKERCTAYPPVTAVACTLMALAGGCVELIPISALHPLSQTTHFVAGIAIPGCQVMESSCSFEALYASLGVAVMATVLDGDCAFDVMTMMLGMPSTTSVRNELRIELSDYLIERIGDSWLHDIMVACQELCKEDVDLCRSWDVKIIAAPTAPAPAVADPALSVVEQNEIVTPDEETFAAMRWVSKLEDDSCVLSLIRSLPKAVVEEQVLLYRRHDETAVAVKAKEQEQHKISLGPGALYATRMQVARRFHKWCKMNGIVVDEKLPYGTMKTFIRDNIAWKGKQLKRATKQIRQWYGLWHSSPSNVDAAEAEQVLREPRSQLKSRAPVSCALRRRAPGAGAHFKAQCVREALYEWFSGIRYAIDWQQVIAENRSRGKKHLARFPRALLRLKLQQLIQDYTYACLLNGRPVNSFRTDSHWFKRWEEDYGLSMRSANRKYAVSRGVVKERMEISWVVLFRIRLFIFLAFGYDPLIQNFDQSPFHHNETGSQSQPTLAVKGGTVPVVEGNSDVKSRWTGNFTTQSRFTGSSGDPMPPAECMFKAEKDGTVDARLQAFLRSRGFPKWFTVTVGPKGSYRERDVIEFLRKHLEPWKPGRDWRIMMMDDYAAHKGKNVWNLCWSCGYVRHCHGGGSTPVAQTCDTDLNQHVRHNYGAKESRLLLEKMRSGQVVPRLTPEECMLLMLDTLSDPALHMRAAEGYKKVGQSIDLHGAEDTMVCREAGVFWNEETTDGFPSMRPKIDAELAAVADEFRSGGIKWCERDVLRLITPYPAHPKVDRVLERLGDDFYHDEIHCLDNGDDGTAVAEGDQEANNSSSDETDRDEEPAEHDPSGVASEGVGGAASAEPEGSRMESDPLSASEADAVHKAKATMAALEGTIEGLRAIGSVSGVHKIEVELGKVRRRQRRLVKESPAVADAFMRLRRAEDQDRLTNMRLADQHRERKREANKALSDRDAAVAELRAAKRKIQEMESICASRHAIKSFTLEALGEGDISAGGAKSRKNRFEVLDRLARIRAGLSPAQKNDWLWFKEAWDKEMVAQHGANWASLFAGWMQNVLNDESSNAFSTFVYKETRRVFHSTAALHVPGV